MHVLGDLMFFILIWLRDSTRVLVTAGGADKWFWIHVAQAIVFATLALMAFRRLANQVPAPAQLQEFYKARCQGPE